MIICKVLTRGVVCIFAPLKIACETPALNPLACKAATQLSQIGIAA